MWRARTCRDVGKAIHPGPHTPERHPRHLIVAVAASAHGPTPQTRSRQAAPDDGSWEPREERGVPFVTGGAFFRPESCAGRDLAVLAAALHKRRTGRLRVLEACCGSGMRGARYLAQGGADEVWCNDGSTNLHAAIVHNLCTAARVPCSNDDACGANAATAYERAMLRVAAWEAQAQVARLDGMRRDVWQWDVPGSVGGGQGSGSSSSFGDGVECAPTELQLPQQATSGSTPSPRSTEAVEDEEASGRGPQLPASRRRLRVSHMDANRLLTGCYLRESFWDLIDIDSFGSDTMPLPAAIDAVRYGGLLYLTSTDGFTSAGKKPERGLAAYGAYPRALPWSNEQGLRMLIGAAVREAASRGVCLWPVFSLYSYHGPVFRVMLRATRTPDWPAQHYSFVGHCFVHGDNYAVGWRDLGAATCRCEARGRAAARRRQATQTAVQQTADAGDAGADAGTAPGVHTGSLGHDAGSCSPQASVKGATSAPGLQSGAEASPGRGHGVAPGAAGGRAARGGTPLVLSGPMWTGPLHDAEEVAAMAQEARDRGWSGFGGPVGDRTKASRNVRPLEELLEVLAEEADPRLPPGSLQLDGGLARSLARAPPRDALIAALREEGYAAARCHLEARAIRTDACVLEVVRVAEERLGVPRRAHAT